MPDLNMKHVRAFLAVVDERSTTRAAHRLGIGRDGVADRVHVLERALGKILLEKSFPPNRATQGRTQLTEAGLALLPKVAELLRMHDALFDEPVGPDPREMDRVLATGLAELTLKTLRQDLSDADRIRVYNALAE